MDLSSAAVKSENILKNLSKNELFNKLSNTSTIDYSEFNKLIEENNLDKNTSIDNKKILKRKMF